MIRQDLGEREGGTEFIKQNECVNQTTRGKAKRSEKANRTGLVELTLLLLAINKSRNQTTQIHTLPDPTKEMLLL
jgi:hypothetical protein